MIGPFLSILGSSVSHLPINHRAGTMVSPSGWGSLSGGVFHSSGASLNAQGMTEGPCPHSPAVTLHKRMDEGRGIHFSSSEDTWIWVLEIMTESGECVCVQAGAVALTCVANLFSHSRVGTRAVSVALRNSGEGLLAC